MARRIPHAPAEQQLPIKPPEPAPSPQNGQATNGDGATKGTPPVWKKRLFSNGSWVECAVFRTEVERGQSSFAAFDVVLDRSYRDGEGKWHTSQSLRRDDLLVAAHVLQRAYAWISEQEKS
ncbi:MAG TPA: hypothetical protein VEA69_25475 [Tepidisphaeraceae bacterium]|nr:hypothetical protein [Tepidisphaeraceae bacterium]